MPDIQLCTAVDAEGRVCRLAYACRRQTATPSEWQAWGPPAPDFDPAKGCSNFWDNGHE